MNEEELSPRIKKLRDKLRQEQKEKIEEAKSHPPRLEPENLIIPINIKISAQMNRALKNFVDKYGGTNISKYCRQKVQEGLEHDEKSYEIIEKNAIKPDFIGIRTCPYCKGIGKVGAYKAERPDKVRPLTERDVKFIKDQSQIL